MLIVQFSTDPISNCIKTELLTSDISTRFYDIFFGNYFNIEVVEKKTNWKKIKSCWKFVCFDKVFSWPSSKKSCSTRNFPVNLENCGIWTFIKIWLIAVQISVFTIAAFIFKLSFQVREKHKKHQIMSQLSPRYFLQGCKNIFPCAANGKIQMSRKIALPSLTYWNWGI